MNKLSIIIIGIILTIFGILLYTTASPKEKPVPELPPEAQTFQAISLSPNQTKQTDTKQIAAQPTVGVEEGMKASYSATIATTKGDIHLTLISKAAPQTVKNFIEKAQGDFYKNLTFHRVEEWVIQGGDPKGDGTGGGQMQTELSNLPFTTGSLGVARGADIRISNASQFFITKSEAFWLNEKYTNFGLVTEGMDVVNRIQVGDKILSITIK